MCEGEIDITKPETCEVAPGSFHLRHTAGNCVFIERPKAIEPPIKLVKEKGLSNSIAFPPVEKEQPLTRQQEQNIAILSYGQAISGKTFEPDVIHTMWPTDPSDEWRAGKRPSVTAIRQYQATDSFKTDMAKRGVNVNANSELSVEQLALLHILTDSSDKRGFGSKLRQAGIKPATYRAWIRQRPFQEKLKEMAGSALNDAIPIAEAQLAAQAANGDFKALKFMFEVTGRHDPARQQAIDMQALIGVIIDVMQEQITDANMQELTAPELLQKIQQEIKFKSQGVKGVL